MNEAKFCPEIPLDEKLQLFPVDINQPKLIAFVDATYVNDHREQRSTTGLVFICCGGAIIYRSKIQTVTTLSSTEAKFLTAVLYAKIALYLLSI